MPLLRLVLVLGLLVLVLGLLMGACAHPVLDCNLKEVTVAGQEYYQGPCKPASAGKY